MSAVVEAVHLVDQGSYLVKRTYGVELEVDGLPAPAGDFVVSRLDSILQVERRRGEVLNYADEQGTTISTAEHERLRAELLQGSEIDPDDDDGRRRFPTLDAEFEFRKFEARWRMGERAPDVVKKSPVEARVIEVRTNSGDPDIISLWNAPHVNRDATLYSFSRDAYMIRLCRELAQQAGLELEIPSHSALRYAKLDGAYAFDDTFAESRGPFISTLAECRAEKERSRQRVTSRVHAHAIKKAGKPIPNAGDVLLTLRDLQQRLAKVHAKSAASESELSYARKRVTDLIATIEQASR